MDRLKPKLVRTIEVYLKYSTNDEIQREIKLEQVNLSELQDLFKVHKDNPMYDGWEITEKESRYFKEYFDIDFDLKKYVYFLSVYSESVVCPCCYFPTIGELDSYEICSICSWEADLQGDHNLELVLGGPNGDYSLKEARDNYKKHKTMYRPSDSRFPTNEEYILLRDKLIKAYENYSDSSQTIDEIESKLLITPVAKSKLP